MTGRDQFVASRRQRWDRLERLLASGMRSPGAWSEMSSLYRALCADLARAHALGLPRDVHTYLDDLAGRAHNHLYGVRRRNGAGIVALVLAEFPRELRRSWRFFLAATALFYLPFLFGGLGAWWDPAFATTILPESTLAEMEDMYLTADLERTIADDVGMAGFYVMNNIGIALRCFATGVFAGLGSVFFLVYNGLVMGTVEGYLWAVGGGWNLLTFTAGHSAWELTAITIAGAAGLRLGWALVVTEGRTRSGSLRAVAPSLYRLVAGTVAMLAVAAAIEGFWSAGPAPAPVKWGFGLLQAAIVVLWLVFGGRGGPR